jgi:two-component system, NarL family, nitrate/nitrite response regulator NarL
MVYQFSSPPLVKPRKAKVETTAEIAQKNVIFTLGESRDGIQDLQALFCKLVTELHTRYQQEFDPSDAAIQKQLLLQVKLDGYQYALVCIGTYQPTEATETALSPREFEIARLISKGLPNKAIAMILEISPWTVATHLRRIFIKLEVKSRAEMVAKLMKTGDLRPTSVPLTELVENVQSKQAG